MDQPLILDRYRPLEVLGEGGHGTVVLAFDTRMARRVAVKIIPLPRAAPAEGGPPGLEEARTAAMLNHPAIVTVHEWDSDEDEAYLIAEYVPGVSLAELLDHFGPLDLDEAAAVLGPVAGALAFAHDNGVLHLDLKPENVLVDLDGRVKVADFGISELTDAMGSASGSPGTLGYMPLEQLRDEYLDAATDQWAFAALAFEVLADATPFAADTVEGAAFKADIAEPPAPTDFRPDLPEALDDVLLAALSPDPQDRYPSVSRLASQLLPRLGDPEAGADRVAALVRELAEEEPEEDLATLGLWDRLARHSRAFRRSAAAVLCAGLVWVGLSELGIGAVAVAAGSLAVAMTAAVAPGLGLALSLLAVSLAVLASSTWAGIAMLLAVGVYWTTFGRFGHSGSYAPLASPLLALGPLGLAPPVLLGFVLPPKKAVAASAVSAFTVMCASALSGGRPPLLDVGWGLFRGLPSPGAAGVLIWDGLSGIVGPMFAIAGWMVAGLLSSLLCGRGTRAGAALGTAAALGVLIGAYGVWALEDPSVTLEGGPVLEHVAGSLILMTVVIALGPPTRQTRD